MMHSISMDGWARQTMLAMAISLSLGLAGCGGSASSNNSTPPTSSNISVTSAPASQTVVTGQTATFSVSANSSAALSYQWQKNGVDIPGATSSTYVTPVVDTSADNAQFAVHIVAGASSLTTAAAALHVYADTATPAPTEYIVNPSATDGAIDATQGNHYAYINTAVTSKGKLFVFMPGTGGIPLVYRLIVQAAANNGFHAIGLAYENDISVGDLCSGSTDHDCAGKVREERFSGQDVSTLVSVNPANGIQNRLNKALAYLAQQHPQDGWGQFLDNGGNVVWDHVRVSGHSQGGGAAGYIGKQRLVDQVCFFSSPADIDNVQLTLATWVTAPGVTPASRYFGFSHLRDGMIPWTLIQQQWPAFGMDAFGTFVDVDSVARPYNQSHMLSSNLNKPSWVTVPDADAYHAITVVDARTPLDVNGLPTYRQVWQYQCFL
ncbi:MAG: BPSS1187 family protein [Burkholderiaceae bacterium]